MSEYQRDCSACLGMGCVQATTPFATVERCRICQGTGKNHKMGMSAPESAVASGAFNYRPATCPECRTLFMALYSVTHKNAQIVVEWVDCPRCGKRISDADYNPTRWVTIAVEDTPQQVTA